MRGIAFESGDPPPVVFDGGYAEEVWVGDEVVGGLFPGSFGCAKEMSAELEPPGRGSEMV